MKKLSLFVVALVGVVVLGACSQIPADGSLDDFATCIKDAGITVYVQDGCSHCITQEKLFGASFDKLNVVNCSLEIEKCGAIGGTPTWILPNAEQLNGLQSLETLSEVSECDLIVDDMVE